MCRYHRLGGSVTGLSPQRPRFDTGAVPVRFEVRTMAPGKILLQVLWFPALWYHPNDTPYSQRINLPVPAYSFSQPTVLLSETKAVHSEYIHIQVA